MIEVVGNIIKQTYSHELGQYRTRIQGWFVLYSCITAESLNWVAFEKTALVYQNF